MIWILIPHDLLLLRLSLGRKSLALKADVSNGTDVEAMFASFMDTFQKIDILVNNAGITRDGLLVRMKEEDWDLVLNVNLKSAFLCCKEAARPMMKAAAEKLSILLRWLD